MRATPFRRTIDSAGLLPPATPAAAPGHPSGGPVPPILPLPPIWVAAAAGQTSYPNPSACPRLAARVAATRKGVDPSTAARLAAGAAAATAAAAPNWGGRPAARHTPLAAAADPVGMADILPAAAAHGAGLPLGDPRRRRHQGRTRVKWRWTPPPRGS